LDTIFAEMSVSTTFKSFLLVVSLAKKCEGQLDKI